METRLLTCSSHPAETMRYLLERIRCFWPGCLVEDQQGEQYGRHATCLPLELRVRPDLKAGPMRTLTIGVTGADISLHYCKPIAEVADHVIQDPIWGPDWQIRHGKA